MSNRFVVHETSLSGLRVVRRLPLADPRGFFERVFCTEELAVAGFSKPIAQINRSRTSLRGTIRGMHFQYPPHAEIKLVSCLRGTVLDVAVDLRAGSSTFLSWHAELLSEENHTSLLLPEGFAHGFQTLSDQVEMLYLHCAPYAPGFEGGLHPLDPSVGIVWPEPPAFLSERDAGHPLLCPEFTGLVC